MSNRSTFPVLFEVAKVLLATSAEAGGAERLHSSSKRVFGTERGSLSGVLGGRVTTSYHRARQAYAEERRARIGPTGLRWYPFGSIISEEELKDNEEDSDDDDDDDANDPVPDAEVDDGAYDSFDDDVDDDGDVDDDRDDDGDAEVIDDEVVDDEAAHRGDELIDDEVQIVDSTPRLAPAVDYAPDQPEDFEVPQGEEDLMPPTLPRRQRPRRTVKRKTSEEYIYDLKRARK